MGQALIGNLLGRMTSLHQGRCTFQLLLGEDELALTLGDQRLGAGNGLLCLMDLRLGASEVGIEFGRASSLARTSPASTISPSSTRTSDDPAAIFDGDMHLFDLKPTMAGGDAVGEDIAVQKVIIGIAGSRADDGEE